jgi:transcriptional regulator with XRE-family HTH domain
MEERRGKRRRIVVDDSALAARIGERIRIARRQAGLTQQQLAEGRYTKAYISALEKGHAKPSMAALNFISQRLGLPASRFLADANSTWDRLSADLALASGDWIAAADAYRVLLDRAPERGARAELLLGLAEAYDKLERGDLAVAPAAEAQEIFRALGRQDEAALASYWLADGHLQSDNRAEARSQLQELRDELRVRKDSDVDLRIRVLTALGTVEGDEREFRAAIDLFEEALALTHDLDQHRRASLLHRLAQTYESAGDLEAAVRVGRDSLTLYRSADAQHDAAVVENQLALAHLSSGNIARASELAEHARMRHELEGDDRALAYVAETQARIAIAEERYKDAIRLATEARDASLATGNAASASMAMLAKARAETLAGRTDDANASYEIAIGELRIRGPVKRLQQGLGEWAELLAKAGRHEEAYALTREALEAPAQFTVAPDRVPTASPARRPRRTTAIRTKRSTGAPSAR